MSKEALAKQEQGEPVAIHQYRSPHCADWYDGIPDHHDGHGPYEVRTLYTTPQPKQEQGEPVIEIEFLDWVHPKIGVMPVVVEGGKPLILRAKLKEKNT